MREFIYSLLSFLDPQWINLIWSLLQIAIVTVCLILTVVFLVLFERKVIGYMHSRVGPNRVGPMGSLQSIADTIKLLLKEVIIPSKADKFFFFTFTDTSSYSRISGMGSNPV